MVALCLCSKLPIEIGPPSYHGRVSLHYTYTHFNTQLRERILIKMDGKKVLFTSKNGPITQEKNDATSRIWSKFGEQIWMRSCQIACQAKIDQILVPERECKVQTKIFSSIFDQKVSGFQDFFEPRRMFFI